MTVWMEDLTSKEFQDIVVRDPLFILPIGATEAHGVHLPLSTDTLQPEALAEELGERMGALIAPTINYGVHNTTRTMPGTVDISFDTLRALTRDVLDSLVRNGARRILVIIGHASGTHMTAIGLACTEVARRERVRIVCLSDWDFGDEFAEAEGIDRHDGHGGIMETARILAIRPELVKDHRPSGEYVELGHSIPLDASRRFPQGIVGEPSKATAQIGRRMNSFLADRLEEIIRRDLGG
jgi:creatinine amidohydrolase